MAQAAQALPHKSASALPLQTPLIAMAKAMMKAMKKKAAMTAMKEMKKCCPPPRREVMTNCTTHKNAWERFTRALKGTSEEADKLKSQFTQKKAAMKAMKARKAMKAAAEPAPAMKAMKVMKKKAAMKVTWPWVL